MPQFYTPVLKTHQSGISANLILNSSHGDRFTDDDMFTFELALPRFMLPELNTHRATSKNLQSSRAVPMKKSIQLVRENPFFPVHWGKNQPGMTSKEEFTGDDLAAVKLLYKEAMDHTLDVADRLAAYEPHKQWASRILEPYAFTRAVVSSTWSGLSNLLWLRNDDSAQPEFQVLAKLMIAAIKESKPIELNPGEWHLPYVKTVVHPTTIEYQTTIDYQDTNGNSLTLEDALKISASCCAQVSYRKLDDSYDKAMDIFTKLFSGSKLHMSPTEHQATPIDVEAFDTTTPYHWEDGITHIRRDGTPCSGNLTNWIQYRQTIPNNVCTASMKDLLGQ